MIVELHRKDTGCFVRASIVAMDKLLSYDRDVPVWSEPLPGEEREASPRQRPIKKGLSTVHESSSEELGSSEASSSEDGQVSAARSPRSVTEEDQSEDGVQLDHPAFPQLAWCGMGLR